MRSAQFIPLQASDRVYYLERGVFGHVRHWIYHDLTFRAPRQGGGGGSDSGSVYTKHLGH